MLLVLLMGCSVYEKLFVLLEEDPVPPCDARIAWFEDLDGDGFGNPAEVWVSCAPPAGWVDVAADCDDADPTVTTCDTGGDTGTGTGDTADTGVDTGADTSGDTSADTSTDTSDTSGDTSADTSDTSTDTSADTSGDTSTDTSTPEASAARADTPDTLPVTSGSSASETSQRAAATSRPGYRPSSRHREARALSGPPR